MTFSVVAFSGRLRAGSSNTGLVRMAHRLAPPELSIELYSIDQLPWYDADLDVPGSVPATVQHWH